MIARDLQFVLAVLAAVGLCLAVSLVAGARWVREKRGGGWARAFRTVFKEVWVEADTRAEDEGHQGKVEIPATLETHLPRLETLVRQVDEMANDARSLAAMSEQAFDLSTAALGEVAESLEEFDRTLGELTEQTNLLALNAAIESARAAPPGRARTLVAEQVESLERVRRLLQKAADREFASHRARVFLEAGVPQANTQLSRRIADTAASAHLIARQLLDTVR